MSPTEPSAPSSAHSSATCCGGGCTHGGWLQKLFHWWVSEAGLAAGAGGFLAGYWLMWNVELQFIWLAVMVLPGLAAQWRRSGAGKDPVLRCMAWLVMWTLAVGLVRHFPKADWNYRWEFTVGAVALPPLLAALWIVCRSGRGSALLWACAASGALSATVSLLWWHEVQAVETAGARLRNPLVYGGLHPVATGLFGGFAIVCLAAVSARLPQERRRLRAVLLILIAVSSLAMFFTLSRGAILATVCGMTVLAAFAGWRRTWPELTALAGAAAVFFFFAGALTPVPVPQHLPGGQRVVVLETVGANPAVEFYARSDSGRTSFYQTGLRLMNSWDKHLTGAGLWEPDDVLERESEGSANHFHSLPVATYIHSGIIGSALLFAALLYGLRSTWWLAREGRGEWLALLACGCSGLIFDGQSACSLVTHPRFEPLLFWLPLVAASAIAGKRGANPGAS